jgi:RNase H-like domain found in reverse transcriptase
MYQGIKNRNTEGHTMKYGSANTVSQKERTFHNKLSIDPAKKEGISKWPMDLRDKYNVQWTMGML